jgi:DNA-binding transcriptional LysR family regulator
VGGHAVYGAVGFLDGAVITLARRSANLDLIMTVGERRIDMIAGGIDLAVCIGDLKVDPVQTDGIMPERSYKGTLTQIPVACMPVCMPN